jgi:DNA-binding transcriptional MerR regulator
MGQSLTIGDFARATHLSVKALRYYHSVGVLMPGNVDPITGYRRYRTGQIAVAQIIRRFRGLDMPIEDIQALLAAPDVAIRSKVIATHLDRLEALLERTQQATASLRDLLQAQAPPPLADLAHLSVPATTVAAITETIYIRDAEAWYQGALGELHASLDSQGVRASGPAGGIYSNDIFTEENGAATVFLPCNVPFRATGRIVPLVVPPAELAIATHAGPHAGIDRVYGALAAYVADHALSVEGAIREYYLVDRHATSDSSQWLTQIGWPIFRTAP